MRDASVRSPKRSGFRFRPLLPPLLVLLLGLILSIRMGTWIPMLLFPAALLLGPGFDLALRPAGERGLLVLVRSGLVAAVLLVIWMFCQWWGEPLGPFVPGDLRLILFPGILFFIVASGGLLIALVYPALRWRRVGWRTAYPLVSYPIIGLFVFLSGLTPVRDSDAWMTGNFWRHEQQFNRLAETAKDEAPGELVYVSNDCVRSRDTRMGWRCGSSVMPEDRWNQYRDLFRQVGVPWEMVRAPSGNTYLVYWRVGGDEKGYLYAPRPPLPVLDALSGLPARGIEKACKKIDGNWYLYFIYSDNMLPGYE